MNIYVLSLNILSITNVLKRFLFVNISKKGIVKKNNNMEFRTIV